ncbi:hypothetical protein POM88_005956 [Heracleum sosnowskyi]|uniref:Uncharacterized protein n=1 Tax=Heracleum sosnowskyi TaxID=360622 RepID=A0AAD8N619_9APIA|nr:hypothetical protein POM88_005956 [Heracleum sosnowskyi]
MGNCMVTRGRSLFQKNQGKQATKAEPDCQTLSSTSSSNRAVSSKLETTTRCRDHVTVENKLDNDNHDFEAQAIGPKRADESHGASRVMRIRVVVTQSQLSQILKESKNSAFLSSSSAAVQQMLVASAIKMRGTEDSLTSSTRNKQGGGTNGKWRPRLKSISEE